MDKNITQIHHIALLVPNFEESLNFYTKGLGFKLFTMWGKNSKTALIDTGNGNYIELFSDGDELKDHSEGYLHLAFKVNDVNEAYNNAIKCGAKPHMEPRVVPLDSEPNKITVNCGFVKGPSGEIIEFFNIL